MPLSFSEAQAVLLRMRYKPGWTMALRERDGSVMGCEAQWELSVYTPKTLAPPAATLPPAQLNFTQIRVASLFHADWQVAIWVREVVEWAEVHESKEWLTFEGELVSMPHFA